MIEIDTQDTKHGSALYTALGHQAASLGKIARLLIANGVPDQPWQTIRSGKTAMYGPSLANIAAFDVRENDTSTRHVKWSPSPYSQTAAT